MFFADRLAGETETAAWVIGLLGISVSIRMAIQAFSGVVTGCHRWDLHNLLNGSAYAITVYAMLVVLWRGYGLIGISAAYVGGTSRNMNATIASRSATRYRDRMNTRSRLPMVPRLATAMPWSGPTIRSA